MKISGRFTGSSSGTPLLARRSIWFSTAHEGGTKNPYAYPNELRKWTRSSTYKKDFSSPQGAAQSPVPFQWFPPLVLVNVPTSGNGPSNFWPAWMIKRRAYSTTGRCQEKEDTKSTQSGYHDQQLMLSMVDGSVDTTVDEHFRLVNDPYLRGYADANGPNLTVSDRPDDKYYPSLVDIQSSDQGLLSNVKELWRAIRSSLKRPLSTDIEYIWNLYQQLPEPRMLHLPAALRHKFMKVVGQEKRNDKSMLRYFSAIADIQNSGLRLITAEWNQALSFAGRYVGHTTRTESEAVIKLWKEMESDFGVKANAVTFNVLFDVASKAGNFILSEMLYKEMERRGYKFNRYHHVSLIHLFGLKMDSDGIRAAYKEMVLAGEMIDSTVLNCVIAGFLRCGEEYAAEHVYQRMKSSHIASPKMPYRNYMSAKVIKAVLNMFARVSKKADSDTLHNHLQHLSPVVPDIKTYDILLTHYALRAPAMEKVAQYLDDMKWFQIPMHGSVFLTLFKGFAKQGGKNQVWGRDRLERIYEALLSARRDEVYGIYISVWMAKWILRAFSKCDSEERMWAIWSEIEPFCEIDFEPQDVEYFRDYLTELDSKPRGSWKFRDTNLFGTIT